MVGFVLECVALGGHKRWTQQCCAIELVVKRMEVALCDKVHGSHVGGFTAKSQLTCRVNLLTFFKKKNDEYLLGELW